MKKLWIPLLCLSLIINSFCIFYVAVGAAAEPPSDTNKDYSLPESVKAQKEALSHWLELNSKWESTPATVLSMEDAPLKFTLYAPEYEGNWGMYQIEYTVNSVYTDDSLHDGFDTERFADLECFENNNLAEGYTFLFVDVIIENKDTEKQMYLMNSISAGKGLLGFKGQTFKNTASLHALLSPGVPFETTLAFAISKDSMGSEQLYINNFGSSSADGNWVYINTEIE